ncbi:MAG: hypothetical protein ACREDR_03735 [Blastocatellia bacterium]
MEYRCLLISPSDVDAERDALTLLATFTEVQHLYEQAQLHLTNLVTQLLAKDRGATSYIPASGTPAPTADIRVKVNGAFWVPPIGGPIELLVVTVENHSPVVCYLSRIVLFFETGEYLFVKQDVVTGEFNSARELHPGQRASLSIGPDQLRKFRSKGFTYAAAEDEINRVYRSSEAELRNAIESVLKDEFNPPRETGQAGEVSR